MRGLQDPPLQPTAPADLVGDLCPDCGALLEPVGSAAEVMGFRRITRRDEPVYDIAVAQAVAVPRPDAQ